MKPRTYVKFTAKVLRQFLLALFFYTVAMAVLFMVAVTLLSSLSWQGDELFYPLFSGINHNREVFLVFCWLAGFLVIFYIYWRKLLRFIGEIVEASDRLMSGDTVPISLPPELRQIEERMNEAKFSAVRSNAMAKEAEQRKNDLIVYLAHDLKTPLTSVIGYLTLLRDEQRISEELRQKYLSIAADKANRLEDLINEFFEITRFNLHELVLETGPLNLSVMLRQMADEMLPVMEEQQLRIETDIADGLMVNADSGKLSRVFDNLLRNAANYSYANTAIRISARSAGDFVSVRIQNIGDTLPPQKLERIFEQFFRLDTARATKSGGAGLGLSIARQITELHGGSITAQSADTVTEFTVVLPLSSALILSKT